MKRNRYGGKCYRCGAYVKPGMGWWDGGLRCESCDPAKVAVKKAEFEALFREFCPVTWASLQKESETNGQPSNS